MTKYYQYRSICIEINRHDKVVITTISVTKCIFLNFGANPKGGGESNQNLNVEFIWNLFTKRKLIKKKTIYKQKKKH